MGVQLLAVAPCLHAALYLLLGYATHTAASSERALRLHLLGHPSFPGSGTLSSCLDC